MEICVTLRNMGRNGIWDLRWDLGLKLDYGKWDGMGFGIAFGTMGIGILPFPTIWAASIYIIV